MARDKVRNVLETKCIEEVMDKLKCEEIEAFGKYKKLNFKATVEYLKNTDNPHYDDIPDKVEFAGDYKELFKSIYESGLIEHEYAHSSILKSEPIYGTTIQIKLKKVELLEYL